jgi:signal transduction histidine kinase
MPDARLLELFEIIGLQIGQFNAQKMLLGKAREAEKWEVLCALISGIAHDFNNILLAIFSCCEMARIEARGNASLNAHLDGLMDGAQRAVSLIRKIPTFLSPRQEDRRPIQLWRVAAEAVHLLRAAVPSAIDLRTSLGKDAPVVLADETQIHRILMNLGVNAAHAMRGQGGCLKIKLENYVFDPRAAVHPDLRAGRYARFTVRDNGHGMNAETMKGIFEAFVTTKEPGEGTGLGLAIVNDIIKSHEGVITVSSRLNKGTTFRVFLPEYPVAFNETLKMRSRLLLAEGAANRAVGDEFHLQRIGAET